MKKRFGKNYEEDGFENGARYDFGDEGRLNRLDEEEARYFLGDEEEASPDYFEDDIDEEEFFDEYDCDIFKEFNEYLDKELDKMEEMFDLEDEEEDDFADCQLLDGDKDEDVVYPPDASEEECEFLDMMRKFVPKKVVHLSEGEKAPFKSSMECVFLEEDPELFPLYENFVKKAVSIVLKENPESDIRVDASSLLGNDLLLRIKTDYAVLDGSLLAEFVSATRGEGGVDVSALTDGSFNITLTFPKAWRIAW